MEEKFIDDNLPGPEGYNYWLGLTKNPKEGKWRWYVSFQEATYTNWHDGEPNNFKNYGEYCAVKYSEDLTSRPAQKWNDYPCDFPRSVKALCQIKKK